MRSAPGTPTPSTSAPSSQTASVPSPSRPSSRASTASTSTTVKPSSFLSKLRSSTVSRASVGTTAREQRALEASLRSSAATSDIYDEDELQAMNEAHGGMEMDDGSDEGIVLSDETGRVDFLTSLPSELVRRRLPAHRR